MDGAKKSVNLGRSVKTIFKSKNKLKPIKSRISRLSMYKKDTMANRLYDWDIITSAKIIWKNSRFISQDSTLSQNVDLVKQLDTEDLKKRFKLSDSRKLLLDQMVSDYKKEVSLKGFFGRSRSNVGLDQEKLSKILKEYKANRKKNRYLSQAKFALYAKSSHDIPDVNIIWYVYTVWYCNQKKKFPLSVLSSTSKFERELLYDLLRQYELISANKNKKISTTIFKKIKDISNKIKNNSLL